VKELQGTGNNAFILSTILGPDDPAILVLVDIYGGDCDLKRVNITFSTLSQVLDGSSMDDDCWCRGPTP